MYSEKGLLSETATLKNAIDQADAIIIGSAKVEEENIIHGLTIGADVYESTVRRQTKNVQAP
ncbi:hypothetical protein AGMMS49940_21250 [Spirochaetia bacterium]|nr:hypothetical protein AGMMS49940_21250 [Spirochaetia bacterium]